MTEIVKELIAEWPTIALLGMMAISILVLGKAADWLVEEAVNLSLRSEMPRVVVGATVVSVGTTTPEAAVSVMAALSGNPGMALGNSVGSIICDTGLILGLACLWRPLPLDRRLVNRQGWVQFGCGVLLVLCCVPWTNPSITFRDGGRLPQVAGFAFLILLGIYMAWSVRLARTAAQQEDEPANVSQQGILFSVLRLLLAVMIVLVSCSLLIASAQIVAERWQVPDGIIAATIVAFGTSLPELIIVLTATAKGQGELAVGNVIGADILNVLFVAGAAAAATPVGLAADKYFFAIQFPAMLVVLLVFRIGIWQAADNKLSRPFGVVLLATYVVYTIVSYAALP